MTQHFSLATSMSQHSTLVYQLFMFAERPIVPVAFALHTRKFHSVHKLFCEMIKSKLPRLCGNVNIVVDGEAAAAKAIEETFSHWNKLNCWNHIVRDAEFQLHRMKASNDDMIVYKAQIRDLLSSETPEDYAMKKASHKKTWSEPFADYFELHLNQRIEMTTAGRLKDLGLDSNGVTTNNSESMNAVFKHLQDWNEVSPDQLVYSMFRLQISYGAQINRSLQGFGPYTLRSDVNRITLQLPQCKPFDEFLKLLPQASTVSVSICITHLTLSLEVIGNACVTLCFWQ